MTIVDGNAREAMAAADTVLMSSGTATLEAMLLKRPMVVAYRFAWLNYFILRLWVHIEHFSLPNLLAGESLVPEYVQNAANPETLGKHLLDFLQNPQQVQPLVERFTAIHHELRKNTDQRAAEAILEVVELGAARQVN